MRAFVPLALLLATSALTACGSKEDSQVTEQRMDDVDSVAGTISDDMVNTDENTDEAPVDAAPPPEAAKPAAKANMAPVKEAQPGTVDTAKPAPAPSAASADAD